MGGRRALAGKGTTRRWKGRGRRREEGKEGSSYPGRIGRKLLQPSPAPGMLQTHGTSPDPAVPGQGRGCHRERHTRLWPRLAAIPFSVDFRRAQSVFCDLQTSSFRLSTALEAGIGFHFHTNFLSVSISAFKTL